MNAMIARSASTLTAASGSAITAERLGGDDGGTIGTRQRLIVEERRDERALASRELGAPRMTGLPDDVERHVGRVRDRRLQAPHVDDAIVFGDQDQGRTS